MTRRRQDLRRKRLARQQEQQQGIQQQLQQQQQQGFNLEGAATVGQGGYLYLAPQTPLLDEAMQLVFLSSALATAHK